MKYVYLAGPIKGRSYDDVTTWRRYVEESLENGIAVLSPMRGKDYLMGERCIQDTYDEVMSTGYASLCRSRFDILSLSQAVIFNFLGAEGVSKGTLIEFGMALAKYPPIVKVVVIDKDNVNNYPFIEEGADFIVDNLDDAIYIINTVLT